MRLREFSTSKSVPKNANAAEQQREKARNLNTSTNSPRSSTLQRVKPIEFEKGKAAIAVGKKDRLVPC